MCAVYIKSDICFKTHTVQINKLLNFYAKIKYNIFITHTYMCEKNIFLTSGYNRYCISDNMHVYKSLL